VGAASLVLLVAKAMSVALLVLAAPLVAGDEQSGLVRCSGIQNDARRLACYDEWARSVRGDVATGWELTAVEDGAVLELTVRAEEEIRGQDVVHHPTFVFACRQSRFEAFVRTGMAAQDEHGGEEKTTVLRFDQEQPFTELLTESDERDALHFPSPLMVASQLLRHDTFYFQFMPHQSRPAAAIFDVRGLDEAIGPLLEACELVVAEDGVLEPRR
jgi:type VI secretion system protein VasI